MRSRLPKLGPLIVAALLVSALLFGCGTAAKPHLWLKPARSGHALTACADPVCGPLPLNFYWDATIANVTGYYVFVNGSQVASVASGPYTFFGLQCNTTYSFGVEAHDNTGHNTKLYATSYRTNACTQPGVYVSNNALMANGSPIAMHGVDRSGTEYMCSQGFGIFDGPQGLSSTYTAMATWDINSVFLGVNEDCWLGVNGTGIANWAADSGQNYINAIKSEVTLIEAQGMYPVIAFYWGDPGTQVPTGNDPNGGGQPPLPDNDHTALLWEEIAQTFKGDPNVMFRLQEEPHPGATGANAAGASATGGFGSNLYQWQCWAHGSVQYSTSSVSQSFGGALTPTSSNHNCDEFATNGTTQYQTVGMQSLVNIIRGVGATNVIQVPGLSYANQSSCSAATSPVTCGMLDSTDGVKLTDPASNANPQLMGDFDIYPDGGQVCGNVACYNTTFGPLITQMPMDLGEIGPISGADTQANVLLNWMDAASPNQSYYAWVWDTWGALINSYSGGLGSAQSPWGVDYYDRLTGFVPPPDPQPSGGLNLFVQAASCTNPTSALISVSHAVSSGDTLFLVVGSGGFTSNASTVTSVSDNINAGNWTQLANPGSQEGTPTTNQEWAAYSVWERSSSSAAAGGAMKITITGVWGQSGASSVVVDANDTNGHSVTIPRSSFDAVVQGQTTTWTSPSLTSVAANDVVLGLYGFYAHSGDFLSVTNPFQLANDYWTTSANCAGAAANWIQPAGTGNQAASIIDNTAEFHYSGAIELHP